MRLLADEKVARDIVAWLQSGGHDVLFAAEASPGTADLRWMEIADQEQPLILTSDKDFDELVFRDRLGNRPGIRRLLTNLHLRRFALPTGASL